MPVISVSDATIVGLSSERNTTFITISYREEGRGRKVKFIRQLLL